MHPRNRILRTIKFLAKAVLILLLVLITFILLIHTPLLQRRMTPRLAAYLSAKTGSRVDIEKIRFSLLGDLTIENLQVWDPENQEVLSVQKLNLTTDLFDLLSGDYLFDELNITGLRAHLNKGTDELNIQFIIDAFTSPVKKETVPKAVSLHFNKIQLNDIAIQFLSAVDGTDISFRLGTGMLENAAYSANPNKIIADKVSLEHTLLNILSIDHPDAHVIQDTMANGNYFTPDFGLGIGLEIHELEMSDNTFGLHRNQVADPPKFDPSHIILSISQVGISAIVVREDTLSASLELVAAGLPGFIVNNAGAEVNMNRHLLAVQGLHLASGINELNGNFTSRFNPSPGAVDTFPDASINAHVRVNPTDISYFLNDTLMNYFRDWKTTEIALEGDYQLGQGQLNALQVHTANSQVEAKGKINDIGDIEKISWDDLVIHSVIGPDFKGLLTRFAGDLKIPPGINLQLSTTGNTKRIFIDGKINSAWGNAKAKGTFIPMAGNIKLDMHVAGEHLRLNEWVDLPWLGPVDFALDAKGIFGHTLDGRIKGLINSIEMMDQRIEQITFETTVLGDNAVAAISIADPDYPSQIQAEIDFADSVHIIGRIQLDSVKAGKLLHLDSTLAVTGTLNAEISLEGSSIAGSIGGQNIFLQKQSIDYLMDTLSLQALISPTASKIDYFTLDGEGSLTSNFDLRDVKGILQHLSSTIYNFSDTIVHTAGNRVLQFDVALEKAGPLQLVGLDIDDFSSMHITGDWDEQKQALALQATSGKFAGYGVSLDSLYTVVKATGNNVTASVKTDNLNYDAYEIGRLDFDMVTKGDTAETKLQLSKDSVSYIGLSAGILPLDRGLYIYPDGLRVFKKEYHFDHGNPVIIKDGNIVLKDFLLTRDSMQISLNGDKNAFDASFRNLDLTSLNALLFPDSAVISKGSLQGLISYVRNERLDLNAHVDSLSLYHSGPLNIDITAKTADKRVPFKFLLSNASNTVDVDGQYFLESKAVDAAVLVDIENLELFSFLLTDILDEMHGSLNGEAKVSGPLQKPLFEGYLRFHDMGFTTANPKFTFNVQDDTISLNNTGLVLDHFIMYDKDHHPLILSGSVTNQDYKSFAYDLKINTDYYELINRPDASKEPLKGLLAIGTDIHLKGNEKDTYVKAGLTVKDTTDLTFVLANDEAEVLNTVGIVEFVDPAQLPDSAGLELPVTYYDSLITSLPDFNLDAEITIEDNASLKVIINEQSGDYFEASGGATLELDYDRTGNAHLSGTYVISKGIYRVSFYDLVKKNFAFVPGSSINWSGSPEDGGLDIKAVHTVESNSIGLIGHEIGENEKSVYKRSLDYEVGINIKGTIEKPIISFSLDLPAEEKANYPVLANKLDRLRLPEFQTELNKQVFGLLVLGGFLPDASVTDVSSNQIATTALYNSVNSLLASQLNRFAGQYIKGVNIDVGIQSYSDYSTPGGKTQTAMDFRVSKSIMNDRLSFEVGGDFDINSDQSGASKGDNYRGDVAIIYDLTGNGDKQLKLFNNETYDIIYQEIRNTGISLVFIREFEKGEKRKNKGK